ncbi:hypothetical protein EJB05_13354 [Eragrostis curvula]|uniref:RRM domain-containing protein n=1 Tax=Eragrostis curvula TaxID=38414 RepID=A0A5J9VXU0_9POAL|nr:hypothetical protein EJB05_13354 [Eragrostis curvula]
MSSGLDMSLDDLIKKSKSRPKANPPSSSGPARRAPQAARAAPYPPAGPKGRAADSPYGIYADHVAALAAAPPPPASARSLETGTKLYISNLDPGVTIEDVQELFSEVGDLKRYSVNYDQDGRSKGTAEVVFARKVDALDAIKKYDGVLLDGKPMKIELIGHNSEPPPMVPLIHNRPLQNYGEIHNSAPQRGGRRGNVRPGSSNQSSGGRGQGKGRGQDRNRAHVSASDLDAELDKYHAEAVKEK